MPKASRRQRARQSSLGFSEAVDEPRGWRAALRRPERPTGGMRVAVTMLVAILAFAVGFPSAYGISDGVYRAGAVCTTDSITCPVLVYVVVLAVLLVALTALGAWWFRLGWVWWLALLALVLLTVEIVGDPFSPWILVIVAVPVLASVLSDPGPPGLRWRRWAVLALAVVALVWFGYVAWDVTRS